MNDWTGKVALVTGAASGIGAAVARAFAARGARVWVTDRDGAAAAAVAERLPGAAGRRLDVARAEDWAAAVAAVRERDGSLDALINNAGVSSGGTLETLDLAEWRRVLSINVEGALLGIRAALPLLREARGAVVNVSSASGRRAQPGAGAYCTSKAALLMLSRVAALELAPDGVRVSCVLPGGVKTSMWEQMPFFQQMAAEAGGPEAAFAALAADTPLGRFCEPDEVAEAVLTLAGSAVITGAELAVDGGYTAP